MLQVIPCIVPNPTRLRRRDLRDIACETIAVPNEKTAT